MPNTHTHIKAVHVTQLLPPGVSININTGMPGTAQTPQQMNPPGAGLVICRRTVHDPDLTDKSR